MSELIYQGGGDLTFHDGAGARRRVQRGVAFEVDAATAKVLLEDPAVIRAEDLPRGNPEPADGDVVASGSLTAEEAVSTLTVPTLRAMAGQLGLDVPKKAVKADLVAAIVAEHARLADEDAAGDASSSGEGDQGGEGTPADDPDASAPGEAGTPPEDGGGAVTLGDLPASAVKA